MKNCILVPIDLSHEANFDLIFSATTTLARRHNAKLHLLTVVPTEISVWPYVPQNFVGEAQKLSESQLAELARLEYADDISWTSEAVIGPIAQTIVKRAHDIGAGLIAIGSHDPKVRDLLLGGTADRVLRRTRCSVLVLRHGDCWEWC
ncbi:universal stress protein UspA-like nucleotide-binding protein [Salinisphaera shabanensis T35B1]|jgi:nucleotide-binding universal stress UspA family protein|uniref:Dethiobiotin synthetase protein n=1 Tax=Salinisphaera shabanensis E1L3A TaxID=1033802 RepID=U2ETC0_9GAMM|nr:universal stress protein [Salinisphaera shabanensis]ERJ20910.1 dethiobiotin synthetase protein [Salinisphaera shabanensis E1L3A]